MNAHSDRHKIVVFTGAGISAESGLTTFNDKNGLWMDHRIEDVATPQAWQKSPEELLVFYNDLREKISFAAPNAAHRAIAELESRYEVIVITQNIDDLHERAGSTNVLHLHGLITLAQSSIDENLIYRIGTQPIFMGDLCEKGSQLRPYVVWYGEHVQNFSAAREHFKSATKILVVGTSLTTQPAASLVSKARHHAEKVLISLLTERKPYGYLFLRGKASSMVPYVVNCWLKGQKVR
ncbi:MAG: Sir2 family NAD-dependent protein deacetylase [Pseudomonas fluorescens]